MRSRFIRVFFFTLALSLLALSCCAFACADGEAVRALTPAAGTGGPGESRGFDVVGRVGGADVASTVGSAGFRTWLRVGANLPVLLAEDGKVSFDRSYGTDKVQVTLTPSPAFDGKAVIITYTVRNISDPGAEGLVIRVGSCGNTAVGGDGGAAIAARGGGFVSESGGLSLLVFPDKYSFSGACFGSACLEEDKLFGLDQDCDMCWYWYLYLQPGETAVRSVVISVGDQQRRYVSLDPNGGVDRGKDAGARQERLAIAGSAWPIPPVPYERGGFRFLGWAVDPKAEKPNYLDGGSVPAGDLSDGMVLYAVWEDKARQTIDADDLVIGYGDSASLSAESTDGMISYAVKTGADVISIDARSGVITTKSLGTATVTVTAAATNDYNETSKDVSVTVTQKALDASMLTLSSESFPYTGQLQTPGTSVRQGEKLLALGTDYEFDDTSVRTATELGEYRITINGLGNYCGSASAVWTIRKRTPAVQVSPYSGTYDGNAKALLTVDSHTGGTLEFSLSQDGPWSAAVPETKAAGSHTVWYRVVGDEFWYEMSPASCTAEIFPRAVTVSGITASDKVYDASLTASLVLDRAEISGLLPGDRVELRSAAGLFADAGVGQNKRVGISAITLSGEDAGNYVLAAEGQQKETTASITKRPITIRARDQSVPLYKSIVCGAEMVTVDGSGLCSYDALSTVRLTGSEVTTATKAGSITPGDAVIVRKGSTQNVSGNYAITYVPGRLTVEPHELKLSWADTEFVYDGKTHVPTATVTGTIYGEVLTVRVIGSKIAATPEGEEYVATAIGLSGTNAVNYKLPENVTQKFVIKPRTLEQDDIMVEYRPDDEISVIGPVPNDGRAYGFKSIAVYDGTRKLVKDVDYTLDSHFSTIYGPHTLHITGKGNYEGCLAREWTMIGDGLVSAGVDVKNGAASVYWNNASEEMANALLNPEDREVREEYGTPTDVLLSIRPAVVPSGVSAKAGQIGESVAVSYDLSLIKRVGNDPMIIRDTDGIPISVTIDIPQEIRKAPLGYYRSFSLIHLHNGTAEVIAQGTGSSFTFTTTTFSAYAISYRDIQLPPTASPPTGDTARLPLWSVLLLFSGCGLLCLTRKRRRA